MELNHTESNDYTDFFAGGPLHLLNEVRVETVEFRINKQHPGQQMLVLVLSGRCIERAIVVSARPDLRLSGHPRGHSLDEETSWSTYLAWGRLSFGFAERHPDCLKTVVFNTAAAP